MEGWSRCISRSAVVGGGEKAGGSVGSVWWGSKVWECRCGILKRCVGAAVVGVRWWVRKVVGHEACEHDLETRETVNLVTNGETCRAKPTITTHLQKVCPRNFP